MSASYRTVGHRLPRLDGAGKATGKARYGVDQSLPGMLYGKLVRSTVPHARLRAIRTDTAGAMPGVRGIVTAAFCPGWIRTRMGGPTAPLEAPPSIAGLRRVIDSLTPERSGKFWLWNGDRLPW